MNIDEQHPLKWPEGFGRTLIEDRRDQRQWKKQISVYIKQSSKELELLGAKTAVITWNEGALAERDPGVAIWFSMERAKDTSWQRTLQIDNPQSHARWKWTRLSSGSRSSIIQIRWQAGSGGDVKIYMKLEESWRSAKAWVQGDTGFNLQNCLPCDLYIQPRMNMAALKLTLSHLRALKRLGQSLHRGEHDGARFASRLCRQRQENRMSSQLQLAGNVAVDELDRLRRVNAQLDEALRQTRNEFAQMRMERDAMMQAVSGLRRLLAPLWGELQDLPAATADAPVRESASRWEAAKRRMPGKPAMFIDLIA
jgi:hypothetical protein